MHLAGNNRCLGYPFPFTFLYHINILLNVFSPCLFINICRWTFKNQLSINLINRTDTRCVTRSTSLLHTLYNLWSKHLAIKQLFSHTLSTQYDLWLMWVRVIVLNATLNNISVISWRSVLWVEETGVPG